MCHTSQNELLDCVKECMQRKIVEDINQQEIGPLYAVMAGEVTDVSDWDQPLGLWLAILKKIMRDCSSSHSARR